MGRKFLTKGVGTPGQVIPVNGGLVDRYPHNSTVTEGGFDSALVEREQSARIVEQDMEFLLFPVEIRIR